MNTLFETKPQVIKSVMNSDRDILAGIRQLYLDNQNFDLDPCYSTGKFYEDLERPMMKMDKTPQDDEVVQNDLINGIDLKDNSIKSIVFDPPFMFGKHGKTDENIMTKRFTMFDSWKDLEGMYKKALSEFYRILIKGGIVAFKCQDYTDSKTTLTHCFVWQWAIEQGFQVEDLFIMTFKGGRVWNSNLKQLHARKYHSYWLVLKKTNKPKYNDEQIETAKLQEQEYKARRNEHEEERIQDKLTKDNIF